MKKEEVIKFIKFSFFSISAGLIEIGSFTLLNEFTKLNYWICYLTALVLSVLWNFTLNRKFTFKSSNNVPIAMLKVFFYYLIFTPLSTYLGDYFVNMGANEYLVTIVNMLVNFITEYLYQKFFVFNDKKEKHEDN